jgi:hypothetical protein
VDPQHLLSQQALPAMQQQEQQLSTTPRKPTHQLQVQQLQQRLQQMMMRGRLQRY